VSASRYWHTIRYLRPWQVVGRLWFHVYQPRVERRPAPARRTAAREWRSTDWREPSLLGPDSVTFLNVKGSAANAQDWNDESHGSLWLYNLHYFDDLTSRGFDERRAWHDALLHRWIRENPAGVGAGWASYPTSLRITNWIKWMLASPSSLGGPDQEILDSLAMQVRWLGKRLETHLLGNHLWANAKGLVMAGLFFDGAEADEWRRRGLEILLAEIDEQILADGGHFERTPMYHAIILEDILDLLQMADVFPGGVPSSLVAQLKSVATRMLRWLRVMSHPDGLVSFFNDAAFGVAAPWSVLAAYAEGLAVNVDRSPLNAVEALPDSGYVRLENDRAVVLCDVAPVGPDYQPAHAHADTLSFELSIDGRRVIVNGGTSTYAPGPERLRERGTAAHSTVEIDSANSTDVWGGFRVARRARPFDVKTGSSQAGVWVEGAHDGYRHLPGRVIHRRAWSLEQTALTVTDIVEGTCARAIARFILHPDIAAAGTEAVLFQCEPTVPIVRAPAAWHPEFGRSLATEALQVSLTEPRVATTLRWS
jgi:uncharacterized heparinase superfamily protein